MPYNVKRAAILLLLFWGPMNHFCVFLCGSMLIKIYVKIDRDSANMRVQ